MVSIIHQMRLRYDVGFLWCGVLMARAREDVRVLTIPSLGITKYLSPGINEISFTPTQTGVLQFTCSMGMVGPGQFNVIN